ncbi:fatty acyl-AMP ligase [Nocardia sp. NPDC058666]|uniref:fatty acyl-AMP ligase n=1 Tax=unclassified Nocardia TaxID=2637762 RepID=UPI00365AE5CE
MSRFTEALAHSASTDTGMVTGEPNSPTRRSWAEIRHRACAIAGALALEGVGPGSRVAILVSSPVDVAPLIQAVWMRRAAFTMLQPPTSRANEAQWAEQTGATLSMLDAQCVVVDDSNQDPFDGVRVLRVGDLSSGTAVDPLDPDDAAPALLQLSSGSTGTPKAIVITHQNLHANIKAMVARFDLDQPDQVAVSWLPLYHDMGMVAFLALPMMTGMDLISVTPTDFLVRPLLWAELISRHRGTFTAAPNFAYSLLGQRLSRVEDSAYDLSSMRYAVNGAEPVDCVAMDCFQAEADRFGWPDTALVGAYGMAEATLTISAPPRHVGLTSETVDPDTLERNAVAVPDPSGRRLALLSGPVDGTEVRVVGTVAAIELDCRQLGEFQIRGESVAAQYITIDGLVHAQDAQGWLSTGDLGYLTEHGEVVICGRRKDVIIVSGRNIFPTDIERAVETVEGVRRGNVAAVSLNAGTANERFAVMAETTTAVSDHDAEQLRRAIATAVLRTLGVAPARILVAPAGSVPKTTSGKLQRGRVRDLLAGPRS